MLIAPTWLRTAASMAGDAEIAVIALADDARRRARVDRRRLRGRRRRRGMQRPEGSACFMVGGFCGKACGFWLISCSTSRCSRTSTSWRIVTLRLISIGLSGALTEMQLASGAPALATAMQSAWLHLLSHLVVGGGAMLTCCHRRLGLLLLLLDAADLGGDSRNVVERTRKHVADHLARVADRLGGRDQRAEWTGDGDIELERDLAQQAADDFLCLVRLADADAVDREPRRELAGKVAVKPDDHRLEAQVAQCVEGDIAHRAKVGLVDHAVVGERAAAAARESRRPPTIRPPDSSKIIGSTPSKVPVASSSLKPSDCRRRRARRARRPRTSAAWRSGGRN